MYTCINVYMYVCYPSAKSNSFTLGITCEHGSRYAVYLHYLIFIFICHCCREIVVHNFTFIKLYYIAYIIIYLRYIYIYIYIYTDVKMHIIM